jgi:hypothetical protein
LLRMCKKEYLPEERFWTYKLLASWIIAEIFVVQWLLFSNGYIGPPSNNL